MLILLLYYYIIIMLYFLIPKVNLTNVFRIVQQNETDQKMYINTEMNIH